MTRLGRLLVLEGPDGIGKSTAAADLAAGLQAAGERCIKLEFPGLRAGSLGGLVYRLHHDPAELGVETISPLAKQTMHVAAHVDAIAGTIRPQIEAGTSVVLDRFWWSTFVYGLIEGIDERSLRMLIAFEVSFWQGLRPATVFMLDREAPWRDIEDGPAWRKLRAAYLQLAEEERREYPVEIIRNDSTKDALLTRLRQIAVLTRPTDQW